MAPAGISTASPNWWRKSAGDIDISRLPVGDPTLSDKEIIGNESQERMGLVMKKSDTEELHRIADRERAPFYVIGEVSGKGNFTLRDSKTGNAPIDLALSDMFGSTPKTVMHGNSPCGGADGHGGFTPMENGQTPAGMTPGCCHRSHPQCTHA